MMKTRIILFILFFIGMVCGYIFFMKKITLTPEQIVERVRRGCPQAEDVNRRFEKLYEKFGKGKTIPYKFVDGQVVNWNDIYYNFDYLLAEEKP